MAEVVAHLPGPEPTGGGTLAVTSTPRSWHRTRPAGGPAKTWAGGLAGQVGGGEAGAGFQASFYRALAVALRKSHELPGPNCLLSQWRWPVPWGPRPSASRTQRCVHRGRWRAIGCVWVLLPGLLCGRPQPALRAGGRLEPFCRGSLCVY